MNNILLFIAVSLVFSLVPVSVSAQDQEDDDLLVEEVKPVKVKENRYEKEKW